MTTVVRLKGASMRWLNVSIVVVLIAIIALAVATWTMRKEREKLAEENVALQETKSALDQSVKQAQEQTAVLSEAVKDSQQYERNQKSSGLRKRDLSEGLAPAVPANRHDR